MRWHSLGISRLIGCSSKLAAYGNTSDRAPYPECR